MTHIHTHTHTHIYIYCMYISKVSTSRGMVLRASWTVSRPPWTVGASWIYKRGNTHIHLHTETINRISSKQSEQSALSEFIYVQSPAYTNACTYVQIRKHRLQTLGGPEVTATNNPMPTSLAVKVSISSATRRLRCHT